MCGLPVECHEYHRSQARYYMTKCGVYGVKGKMRISNKIANQSGSLPLTKYATYLLIITTSTFILKIH